MRPTFLAVKTRPRAAGPHFFNRLPGLGLLQRLGKRESEMTVMRSKHVWITLLVACPLFAGCKLLTPLIFVGEPKKKVTAEFDKLVDSRAAILVWTDQSTLFDYPYARFELATYVGDKLYAEMGQRQLGVEIVDPRDVEDFIQQNIDAQINPRTVGERFDADYVVYVEVLEFQIRDAEQPQFLRGRIHASVTVHDIRADPDLLRTYELAPVECVYPEHGPILLTATNSPQIREATYHKFSELVARKFYEHTVEL